jgi:hypothetical protein
MTKFEQIGTLLTLEFSARKGWKQTATNKRASQQVASDNSCNRDRCRVVVSLFENATTKAISNLFQSVRLAIADATFENGTWLPAANFERVKTIVDNANATLARLLVDLRCEYASYLQREQAATGTLFNASEYENVDDIIAKTTISAKFKPFADVSKFDSMVELGSYAQTLRDAMQNDIDEKLASVEPTLIERLQSQVTQLCGIVENYHANNVVGTKRRLDCKPRLQSLLETVSDCQKLNVVASATVSTYCVDLAWRVRSVDIELLKQPAIATAFCAGLRSDCGLTSEPEASLISEPEASEPEASEPVEYATTLPDFNFDD